MREKLIELLKEAEYKCLERAIPMTTEEREGELVDGDGYGFYADHLIANGVTLDNQVSSSKWISVTERLPKNRQDVLVVAFLRDCWNVCLGWYAPNGKVWHVGLLEETCYPVSHWMPLPQPPKGE